MAVVVPITFLSQCETFTTGAIPIPTWGGLRGVIDGKSVQTYDPYHPLCAINYAVVWFSDVAQGQTIKPMIERPIFEDSVADV